MEQLPLYISYLFIGITAFTFWMLAKAGKFTKPVIAAILVWLVGQSALAFSGFYLQTDSAPPRFVFAVLPTLMVMAALFSSKKGRRFLQTFNLKTLTLLHVIRIPVELVLYALFSYKLVPELMTFEGRNADILSGITAPLVFLVVFVMKKGGRKILLAWNLICLALLFNIVINAILAAPSPIQTQAFDQPNIAILYFPFILLPAFVVPVVLMAHLVSILKLLAGKEEATDDAISKVRTNQKLQQTIVHTDAQQVSI